LLLKRVQRSLTITSQMTRLIPKPQWITLGDVSGLFLLQSRVLSSLRRR